MNTGRKRGNKLDQVVAGARRQAMLREQDYARALTMYPWICGRCAREFTRENLRELTVHHRDHDHDNNPPDGSNWELLWRVLPRQRARPLRRSCPRGRPRTRADLGRRHPSTLCRVGGLAEQEGLISRTALKCASQAWSPRSEVGTPSPGRNRLKIRRAERPASKQAASHTIGAVSVQFLLFRPPDCPMTQSAQPPGTPP